MTELKPCPFCGTEAQEPSFLDNYGLWVVSCQNSECEAEGPSEVTKQRAVIAWNRRSKDE